MKTLFRLSALALIMGLAGCSSGGDDDPTPTPKPENPAKIEITASESAPVLPQEGGSATVTFTTTAAWSASVASTRASGWCTVSPTSGAAGAVTLTVTTIPNDTYDERNATVTLRAGNTSQTFTVKQKQKDGLTVTSNKIEAKAEGDEVTVEVKANVQFTYEIAEDAKSWLTAASTRGLTATQLKFKVAENETFSKREGQIVIKSGAGSETVTVYQEGAKPAIVLTQNEYTVKSEGETLQIELKSNVEYEMQLGADWLTEVQTRALSSHTHYIVVSPNEGYEARTAEITFIDKANGLEEKVKVTQQQKDGLTVTSNKIEVKAEGGEVTMEVKANVSYTVSINVDWMRQAATSRGLKEEKLRFVVDENPSQEPREGKIILSAGTLQQEVTVIQQAPGQSGGGIDDMPVHPW